MKSICSSLFTQGFLSGLYSDINVSVLGNEYKLHRLVLLQNEYFKSMFGQGFKEKDLKSITIQIDNPHITPSSVTTILSR